MITKVNEVLEVSLPQDNILLNLNPTETSEVSGEQDYNIIVATNHIAGYNLVLSANSTDFTRTKEHQSEPSATIPTVAETAEGYTTPNDFEANHWGFKLGNNNYNAFKTSQLIGKSTGPVRNDEINLKSASKVNFSQPAGTYNLTINFNATANIITGVEGIVFNGNGADNPDAMPPQMITAPGTNLNANQFTRGNYVFVGWNTGADGTGTEYADGVKYMVADEEVLKTTILYAQWALPLDKLTYMQDATSRTCDVTAEGATATLIDKRDNKTYTAAKINGLCTMTQNLRLDAGEIVTSENSNVPVGYSYIIPNVDLDKTSPNYPGDNTSYAGGRIHHGDGIAGNWYNYATATAETGSNGYDICPKNWRLPTGGKNGEQRLLTNNASLGESDMTYVDIFKPAGVGYYSSDGVIYPAKINDGRCWSNNAEGNSVQLLGYEPNRGLRVGFSQSRANGDSVRCVLK